MYHVLVFISYALFFFFLDMLLAGLFAQQILHCLFIFSLATISKMQHWSLPLFFLLLLACQSLLQTGVIGPTFVLYTISYAAAYYLIHYFSNDAIIYYGSFLLFLIAHIFLAYYSLSFKALSPLCTGLKFTGNLILLYFSLKWLSAVERGNRF